MKTLDVQQRSESWYAARRGLPTCSRFSSILTAAKELPSSAQDTLIAELISESILPPEQGVIRPMTDEMREGMVLEGEARCAYELNFSPSPVTEVGFLIHESGLYGGSPDGLVREDGGVEIKCVSGPVQVKYILGGVIPLEYRLQVAGYLAVTGRNWWSFFSYCRNLPPFHVVMTRGPLVAKLEAELINFCARYNEVRAKFDLPPIGNK